MTRIRWRRRALILAVVAGAAVGCGDDRDLSPIPALRALRFETTTVAVGTTPQLAGSFSYLDGDADVSSLFIEVTTPTAQAQTVGPSPAENVAGHRSGTLAFTFTLNAGAAGAYALAVWVVDALGNESNHLAATITAQ
ncbi:MAG: hypothetical protein HY903_08895 [Deltaproteobacteria bacterium]|nr:hypothetical protein [Deltaproteobacteria bacterium]